MNDEMSLPGGIGIRLRRMHPSDRPDIDWLRATPDAASIGPAAAPPYGAEVIVAQRPWGGPLIAVGWWARGTGARGSAAVTTDPVFARSALAAHLLVRLARMADAALVPSLDVAPLAGPAGRFVRQVFGLPEDASELPTHDWHEARARAGRLPGTWPRDRRPAGAPRGRRAIERGIVIAGGGVAALETLLALRELLPDAPIRLVAPNEFFVVRPEQVEEPFSERRAARHSVAGIAADFRAEVTEDAVTAVDPERRTVITAAGGSLGFDALVVALGARALPVEDADVAVGVPGATRALRALIDGAHDGTTIAFAAPAGAAWTLPLYELAMLTARRLRERGVAAAVRLVTPEARPLAVFGPAVERQVAAALAEAGVEFRGSSHLAGGRMQPGKRPLRADHVVALPTLRGPSLPGLPHDAEGFLPTDPYGRVARTDAVFAAGDCTTFPVKQGGLAAQQADAAAEAIAATFGVPVEPRPFRPVLRGLLLTGMQPRFLRAGLGGGEGDATVSTAAAWSPAVKVAAAHLGPYLAARSTARSADA